MTTAIVQMDVNAHKDQINAIQRVLKEVMIDGKHYGKIPGCGDKPALLKPGAEKIMATFGIRPEVKVEESSDIDGSRRYRVIVRALTHHGDFLGEGVGECSTAEEKYAWESCADNQFDITPESCRRIRWRRKKDGSQYEVKQVRTNPADKANTVLKMAKKRALVDMVLTVTAASDIFEQDLDEEHLRPDDMQDAPAPVAQPQRKNVQATVVNSQPAPAPTQSPPPAQAPTAHEGDEVMGKVQFISAKEGTKGGRDYTKYGVKVDDAWFNTFDGGLASLAEQIKANDSTARIIYKAGKWGNDIIRIEDTGSIPF